MNKICLLIYWEVNLLFCWIASKSSSDRPVCYNHINKPITTHVKLQTKVSVLKMSQSSASQHSTQTTIKLIAFKQNIGQQKFWKSGSILAMKETWKANRFNSLVLLNLFTVVQRQIKTYIKLWKTELGQFQYSR
jgi:hypothetical protein